MPIEITMPRLSDTMEAGTVVKWNVKEGDKVASGDVIADIETDKATMELQTFDEGTIAKLVASEGEGVAVGTLIALLAAEGEDVKEAASGAGGKSGGGATGGGNGSGGNGSAKSAGSDSSGRSAVATSKSSTSSTSASSKSSGSDEDEEGRVESSSARSDRNGGGGGQNGGERVFASPLAKKVAADSGVDLGSLSGTGPSGRIVRKDVEAAIASGGSGGAGTSRDGKAAGADAGKKTGGRGVPAMLPAGGGGLTDRVVPLSNMRATIAKRLVESKSTIPHYQVTVSARLDALMALREQLNEQLESQGVKLSVNDFLVRACAVAMHSHPFVNASWDASGKSPAIKLHGEVNIGVAISLPVDAETLTGGGLVVATLRNADVMSLRQISGETRRLAKKAREKGLSVDEMSDSTFTISNLGMFGVDHFTAIINPPNAAILAVGQAVKRPFIEEDEDGEPVIVVGHEMSMTMSSDHRIVDGSMAAQYLQSVKDYLENPATMLV